MKLLIECGAEIDHVTALKRTALVEASWHANKEAMDVLLDAGAKENVEEIIEAMSAGKIKDDR